jgi:stage II sporulation protein P
MVVGPNTPNYDQVLAFAKYIKAVSDTLYPGLCKGIIVKPIGKYNLFISDYASLVEIGSNVNTVDEANECGKLVGEILDIVIRSLEE